MAEAMSRLAPRAPGLGLALRAWFTSPPRRHGEVDQDREVSFLELFYDLVFVVLVAQVAHTLAVNVSWAAVFDFTVVFAMIWIAWLNGSMYHEIHGREDGRSRTYIFAQMFLLVILAVFAAHATGEDGAPFAITYAALLGVLAWQWWSVRRHDIEAIYQTRTAWYVGGLGVALLLVLVSVPADDQLRLLIWTAVVVCWVAALTVQGVTTRDHPLATTATASMAERFGLFTIIVLGEVVVGVVDGLIEAQRTGLTIVTGLLALTIGFGFWWNYFDAVGRRVPRRTPGAFTSWVLVHLPLTAVIAASGAGMVSLIEHAMDQRTPIPTTWLLAGSSALLLVLLAILAGTIDYTGSFLAPVVPRVVAALSIGALATIGIGVLRPQAWLLALLLALVHLAVWFYAFTLRVTNPRTG